MQKNKQCNLCWRYTFVWKCTLKYCTIHASISKERCQHGVAKVTRAKINRGAGYGLEIPCIYQPYGPRECINRMKEIIYSLKTNELV